MATACAWSSKCEDRASMTDWRPRNSGADTRCWASEVCSLSTRLLFLDSVAEVRRELTPESSLASTWAPGRLLLKAVHTQTYTSHTTNTSQTYITHMQTISTSHITQHTYTSHIPQQTHTHIMHTRSYITHIHILINKSCLSWLLNHAL